MSSLHTTASGSSQSNHSLNDVDDLEVSHTVHTVVEVEKDPLGLVEEISHQLDQRDQSSSHQTNSTEVTTDQDRIQEASESQSPSAQQQDQRETDVVEETTTQQKSSAFIIITNINTMEITQL